MEAVTDRERLERAFTALRIVGWYAAGPLPCCGTCAASEAAEKLTEEPERWDRGYVFFHDQDEASAFGEDGILTSPLGLSYWVEDSRDGHDRSAVAAGVAEIARRIWEAGLRCSWNGRLDTRIIVEPFDSRDRYLQLREAGVDHDEARRMTYDNGGKEDS